MKNTPPFFLFYMEYLPEEDCRVDWLNCCNKKHNLNEFSIRATVELLMILMKLYIFVMHTL